MSFSIEHHIKVWRNTGWYRWFSMLEVSLSWVGVTKPLLLDLSVRFFFILLKYQLLLWITFICDKYPHIYVVSTRIKQERWYLISEQCLGDSEKATDIMKEYALYSHPWTVTIYTPRNDMKNEWRVVFWNCYVGVDSRGTFYWLNWGSTAFNWITVHAGWVLKPPLKLHMSK